MAISGHPVNWGVTLQSVVDKVYDSWVDSRGVAEQLLVGDVY